jgi:putative phosphoribosyl transferase
MYFHSRHQAGRMLASRLLEKYRYENCAIVALDDGGVAIGQEIARELHCALILTVAASVEISVPREPWSIGGLTPDGQFVYNDQYSPSDIEEISQENRGLIEAEKINKFHEINQLMGDSGAIDRRALNGHNLILTSDGLNSSFKLDLALAFLKPIRYEKIIVATPLASVNVVDWMHIHADEIYCLSVVEEYSDTNHYYDARDVPEHQEVMKILNDNILNWK